MKRNAVFLLAVAAAVLSVCACGRKEDTQENTTPAIRSETQATGAAKPTESERAAETTKETETEKAVRKEIDPFENVSLKRSGISPFIECSADTSRCSEEIREVVEYSPDKDHYANGDLAVITASLAPGAADKGYVLTQTEMNYAVSVNLEYITSASGFNLALLRDGLEDYIAEQQSAATDGSDTCFDYSPGTDLRFDSCDKVEHQGDYFLLLKQDRQAQFQPGDMAFNRICSLYSVDYTAHVSQPDDSGTRTGTFWIAVSAENIAAPLSGRDVSWGSSGEGEKNFTCISSDVSMDDCVSAAVTAYGDDYDIAKADGIWEFDEAEFAEKIDVWKSAASTRYINESVDEDIRYDGEDWSEAVQFRVGEESAVSSADFDTYGDYGTLTFKLTPRLDMFDEDTIVTMTVSDVATGKVPEERTVTKDTGELDVEVGISGVYTFRIRFANQQGTDTNGNPTGGDNHGGLGFVLVKDICLY